MFPRLLHISLCILLLITGITNNATAQQDKPDSTDIIDRIIIGIDTLVNNVLPDTQPSIDSLLLRKSTRLGQEIFNLIVKNSRDTVKKPVTNTSFAAMDGLIIRNIYFRSVDIFAPEVTDTSYIPVSWFEKLVNISHNDTRKSLLQRYLLFQPGDRLDVFLAADNERILRDLSFIMDARFVARKVKNSPDSVDLILITQDKFPIGLDVNIDKPIVGSFGVTHQNMLGYGHHLSASAYFDNQHQPHLGYSLGYGTTNIYGTFTSARIGYINKWNQESFDFDFFREFRAMSLQNAGGFSFENSALTQSIHFLDTIFELRDYKYTLTDLWFGRIITPIGEQTQQTRSGLYLAARFSDYNSIRQPDIDDSYLYPYDDRIRVLFSLGISRQGNRKDNLIYTFGRTEDVPFGYQFDITSGYEWSSGKSRPYFSLTAAYGSYLNNSSYFSGRVQYGTFFQNGNGEQGVFQLRTDYFSRLYKRRTFMFRNFVTLMSSFGINRNPGEFLTISNRKGIAGLAGTSLRGTDKVVLNLESAVFTPYELLGFKFAVFGGLDLGFIKREQQRFSDSRLFSGINLGIRIRNDQLVFNTFVIRLAFYPGRPDNSTAENFTIDYVPRIRFNDFLPDKPEIVVYQ